MNYDKISNTFILFGGIGPNGVLQDTWILSQGTNNAWTWKNVNTAVKPPARFSIVSGIYEVHCFISFHIIQYNSYLHI